MRNDHWRIIAVLSVIALGATIAGLLQSGRHRDVLPQPFVTASADNNAQIVRQPRDQELHAPHGFSVRVWAEGFAKPRFMLRGSNGEVLVADSGHDADREEVGRPRTRGQDGVVYVMTVDKAPVRRKLVEHLDRPYGLALWGDYLYVAESQSIKRYRYDSTTFRAGRGEEVISLAGLGSGHWTRSLLFDRAGQSLYVGVGSESNVSPGEDPRRAAISRFNPDGSGHEIVASGLRNPIGLHWYPDTDTLWTTVQERDGLGDDLPPDYFTHIERHGFYGWPYAYIGRHPDPRLAGLREDLVESTLTPDVRLGAHVGALDFTFYTGEQFPEEYQGGAFLAFHGSWNREQRIGYSVAFVPFRNGRPSGKPKDFVTGWMVSPASREVWGRPVAVLQLHDGSLLVTDDGGRKIWRVSYGEAQAPSTTSGSEGAAVAASVAETNAGGRTTVSATGCVQRTEQSPTSGTPAGVSSTKFVLTKAAMSDRTTSPVGTSGSSTLGAADAPTSTYQLEGNGRRINPHVGHKVEITGTIEEQRLKVESVRMLASACR